MGPEATKKQRETVTTPQENEKASLTSTYAAELIERTVAKLEASQLFSIFTADIIKKEVLFTR
jgi:hypothetical protein